MKQHIDYGSRLLIIFLFSVSVPSARAQQDSTYVQVFDPAIIGRIYLTRKFTYLNFDNEKSGFSFRYRPNTTLNLGVGASYRWVMIKLSRGFGFLNPERGRGTTDYTDLQINKYGSEFMVEASARWYRGFYLPGEDVAMTSGAYYLRPDLRVKSFGAHVQYVFNHRRFSYRAAFSQNAWQKKSSGSMLIGSEFHVGSAAADSTIIPTPVQNPADVPVLQLRRLNFLEAGPSAGYAYTHVMREHFFITGIVTATLSLSRNTFHYDDRTEEITRLNPNTSIRVSTGYNSRRWAANIVYFSTDLRLASNIKDQTVVVNSGKVKLTMLYRFEPSRKARRVLKVVDKVKLGSD